MKFTLAFSLALLLSSSPALASAAEPPAGDLDTAGADAPRNIAVTLSPLHLLSPILEVTTEFRVDDRVGAAVIGGFGRVDGDFWVYEAGGQVRWYALGSFEHGLQLGGQLLYLHVSSGDIDGTGIAGAGNGLSVGPFVGYKYTSSFGLTFDVQAGAQVVAVNARADDGSSESAGGVGPLVNANIGWSF